ncbi:hypothetical protein [Nakamurella flava]|uniref:hypothetical protein n=1 Tax=Nakamurella flava TaxID=2576308 RepID=UPI00140D9641|nr:hypothetical protein [Nakamurella flava]
MTTPSAVRSAVDRAENAYLEATPISADLIRPLLSAVHAITAGEDISIPTVALRGIAHCAENLAAGLIRAGVPSTRVELVHLHGLRRRIGARWEHDPQLTHTVVLLDRHTDTEVIVDLSIAAFAPVPHRDVSVRDQLGGDPGPFGDSPYVADVDGYMSGDRVAWDFCSDTLE